jgi:hypothetical protein
VPVVQVPVPAPATTESDEVTLWLVDACGLPQYREKFIAGGFDTLMSLKMLDEHDLDALGVTVLGHRRILLAASANLAKTTTR